MKDPNMTMVAPYVANSISIWHCPADTRMGTYTGTNPSFKGKSVAACRSISMSSACGTYCTGF